MKISLLLATVLLLLSVSSRAQQQDCGATGLGCRTPAEIEWVNTAMQLFPNGSGLAHRAFGYYCARHPDEQQTCMHDPWKIVAKLDVPKEQFNYQ